MSRRVVAAVVLATAGCIRAAGSVAEPTALERQLLGAYRKLDEELVWVSSVRGPGGAAPELGDLEEQALRKRLLQRFNEDDLRALKSQGCVGEAQNAEVRAADCDDVRDSAWASVRRRVIAEENEARDVIIRWAASEVARQRGDPVASAAVEAEVRSAYAALLRDAAEPDDLLEGPDGRWVRASSVAP